MRKPKRIHMSIPLVAAGLVAAAASPAAAVHGGSHTTTAANPFVVALETPAGEQWCTGALIAPTKVLTAGHCIAEAGNPAGLRVIAGRTDLTSSTGQVRHVKSYKLDPRYTDGLQHDSAVITLDRPLPHRTVRVARQRDEGLYRDGATATVYGFGRTGTDGPGTRLKQATLALAPLADCGPYTWPGDTPALKACGVPKPGKSDSVCKGDSGGPLVVNGVVLGIVTTGNHYCDDQQPLSVFTRATDVPAEILR
ncbi:trypsin-like serine protease [Streptomyces sp. CB01881]|uniref:S1 family peptidase n=1 Tax=Streptomyces sp. CB01881 TaxID=2078691 RepID=UPI000CDC46DC|nr:trypsin-like serine protease [Streptomyces sp. CB01881]AUY49762.1 serine protease [Streptomyces sp. CB01881]TYC73153.1 trypsin-like serine protease [Streptomyces sp. CB01881]